MLLHNQVDYNQRNTVSGDKMKVMHIYKSYFPESQGGIEQVIQNISNETNSAGCENSLLTTYSGKKIQTISDKNIKIIKFPGNICLASCPCSTQLLKNFNKIIMNADILHYHFPWPFAEFLHVINRVKKPSLVTYHSDIVRQNILKLFYKPFMNNFLKSMQYIVPTSANNMTSSKDLKPHLNKCKIIPLGINKANYIYPKEATIKKWQNILGNNFMLFVGVLRYYKGLHILLDAIKGTNITMAIAGRGPMEQKLKLQANKLQLKNVHFIGYVNDEDKNALLTSCRAVVAPSHLRSEAFCLSLVEGMIFKKPLISTEIGTGTSFVNLNCSTGYVIKPNNVEELKSAMTTLYNNPAKAKQLGLNAYARYESLFTSAMMGNKYLKLYEKMLHNASGHL